LNATPHRLPDGAPSALSPGTVAAAATSYVGRFAPSPTGPLHAGSLVAALASWLDARAHAGRWLLRIEDVDTPRCVPGAADIILAQLAACGLVPDEAPVWQSARGDLYHAALDALQGAKQVYPCACSRKDIETFWAAQGRPIDRHAEAAYPGTCRDGLHGKAARAWRLRCGSAAQALNIGWHDRRLGTQQQDLTHAVGDFVLKRADGLWAYQLAVVVDDAAQQISHVVRGEDLADNTPRQIHLQRLLGLRTPIYLHTPLVLAADGQKLSKQTGARALAPRDALRALHEACTALGLEASGTSVPTLLDHALTAWRQHWVTSADSAIVARQDPSDAESSGDNP
jgi:glutamyl-Q tRNA(Asp) synthetase